MESAGEHVQNRRGRKRRWSAEQKLVVAMSPGIVTTRRERLLLRSSYGTLCGEGTQTGPKKPQERAQGWHPGGTNR